MSASGFIKRWLGRGAPEGAGAADSRGGTSLASTTGLGGAQLEDFEMAEEIGRGAMAAVYRAIDRRTGEQVAIKRLHLQREFAPEDMVDVRDRFMREARAASHLQHPDILRVLAAGESGGDAWMALEYVAGRDLSHHTRPGQLLPLGEVVALGARLARALDDAHRHGVVHRDIKPANVMLDRSTGSVKIMDFGIARVADGSRTRTGLVLGTPSYMSPEQLAGLTVDGRSDLYSLGAMLFQLVTGHLPHQSESMASLMHQIANQPAPDVRRRRPEVPEGLALVVALALEKRPELRYQSGAAMAQDLDEVLTQLPEALKHSVGATTPPPAGQAFEQTLRIQSEGHVHNHLPPDDPSRSNT